MNVQLKNECYGCVMKTSNCTNHCNVVKNPMAVCRCYAHKEKFCCMASDCCGQSCVPNRCAVIPFVCDFPPLCRRFCSY